MLCTYNFVEVTKQNKKIETEMYERLNDRTRNEVTMDNERGNKRNNNNLFNEQFVKIVNNGAFL